MASRDDPMTAKQKGYLHVLEKKLKEKGFSAEVVTHDTLFGQGAGALSRPRHEVFGGRPGEPMAPQPASQGALTKGEAGACINAYRLALGEIDTPEKQVRAARDSGTPQTSTSKDSRDVRFYIQVEGKAHPSFDQEAAAELIRMVLGKLGTFEPTSVKPSEPKMRGAAEFLAREEAREAEQLVKERVRQMSAVEEMEEMLPPKLKEWSKKRREELGL